MRVLFLLVGIVNCENFVEGKMKIAYQRLLSVQIEHTHNVVSALLWYMCTSAVKWKRDSSEMDVEMLRLCVCVCVRFFFFAAVFFCLYAKKVCIKNC